MANLINLDTLLKRYRNLPQYRTKTDAELESIILIKYPELQDESLLPEPQDRYLDDIAEQFKETSEKRKAIALAKRYRKDYDISTVSDLNMVKALVYLECLQTRFQDLLNDVKQNNGTLTPGLVKNLHENLDKIIMLKDKLGITQDKQEKDDLETLKKKYKVWRKKNQVSRTMVCPHPRCGKMIWMKMRTEAWEACKHPFFEDRVAGNRHIVKLYQEKKLTKEDVGLILDVSTDYVGWLIDKWNLDRLKTED